MDFKSVEEYKKYVKERLDRLSSVFAKAAIGDFSIDLAIPEAEDEFNELYVGIQVMVNVIREQLKQIKSINEGLEERIAFRTQELARAQEISHIGSFELDIKTNKVIASEELRRIFGFPTQGPELSLSILSEHIYPEDRNKFRTALEGSIASERAFTTDVRVVRIDDTVRSVLVRGETRKNQDNSHVLIAVCEDVTDRKQAEKTLIDSEKKYRAILEAAPDAIIIIDSRGKITLVNSQVENIFGYKKEELWGETIEMLIPERFHPIHPDHREEYMKNPRMRPMGLGLNLFAKRKDGTEFPVEISLSPFGEKENTNVIAVVRDISDRKKSEEVLKSRSEDLERMNKVMVGRELKMVELKAEIEKLKKIHENT